MSGWNDGVSKQLAEYFEDLAEFGDYAVQAVQEQVDLEVEKLINQLEQTTPRVATLGLLNSIKKSKIFARYKWY